MNSIIQNQIDSIKDFINKEMEEDSCEYLIEEFKKKFRPLVDTKYKDQYETFIKHFHYGLHSYEDKMMIDHLVLFLFERGNEEKLSELVTYTQKIKKFHECLGGISDLMKTDNGYDMLTEYENKNRPNFLDCFTVKKNRSMSNVISLMDISEPRGYTGYENCKDYDHTNNKLFDPNYQEFKKCETIHENIKDIIRHNEIIDDEVWNYLVTSRGKKLNLKEVNEKVKTKKTFYGKDGEEYSWFD